MAHPVKRNLVKDDATARLDGPWLSHAGKRWRPEASALRRIEREGLNAVFVETSDPGRELAVYADINAEAYLGSAWRI